MLAVGSRVVQRKKSFLYINAVGEVIGIDELVDGQPAAQVRWSDGYAMWERWHDMSALMEVSQ